jgi:hypothetical protein
VGFFQAIECFPAAATGADDRYVPGSAEQFPEVFSGGLFVINNQHTHGGGSGTFKHDMIWAAEV